MILLWKRYKLIRLINQDRLSHHWHRVFPFLPLMKQAQRQAEQMLAVGELVHSDGPLPVDYWEWWGENIGVSMTVDAVEKAFMDSQHHRQNILNPKFNCIGIGIVKDLKGQLWIVQLFGQSF